MACHFHSFHKENTESVISYYLGLVNNQTDMLNRFCPATKKTGGRRGEVAARAESEQRCWMKPSSHQFCEVSVRKTTCQVDFHLSSSQMVSRRRINELIWKRRHSRGSYPPKMGAVIRWAGEGTPRMSVHLWPSLLLCWCPWSCQSARTRPLLF